MVISMEVCACSGGFYRSYHVMQGIDEIVPVDVYVPGCPPAPEGLLSALMKIQERIQKGEHAERPRRTTVSVPVATGRIDRRVRREAWERDDAIRCAQSLPPRGVISFPEPPPRRPRANGVG